MTATYAALHRHMNAELPLTFQRGRVTKYQIPDMIELGMDMVLQSTGGETGLLTEMGGVAEELDARPSAEDISVDIDM